jgi:hypothetical protein
LPPLYHTGPPLLAASVGRAAYPVTWLGLWVLNRFRTTTPACWSWAKNSCSPDEAAAAVLTARRSLIRGGSERPWRRAFSDSARVGRDPAVRSRGAVRCNPNRCSAARQASPTR